MPERSTKRLKRPRDFNQTAYQVMLESTGQVKPAEPEKPKDPLAVELGRRGGLKGGAARAAALSAKQRSRIAKQAARIRWRKSR